MAAINDLIEKVNANELTPVEIHFIENFEREQKRITDSKKNKAMAVKYVTYFPHTLEGQAISDNSTSEVS